MDMYTYMYTFIYTCIHVLKLLCLCESTALIVGVWGELVNH